MPVALRNGPQSSWSILRSAVSLFLGLKLWAGWADWRNCCPVWLDPTPLFGVLVYRVQPTNELVEVEWYPLTRPF